MARTKQRANKKFKGVELEFDVKGCMTEGSSCKSGKVCNARTGRCIGDTATNKKKYPSRLQVGDKIIVGDEKTISQLKEILDDAKSVSKSKSASRSRSKSRSLSASKSRSKSRSSSASRSKSASRSRSKSKSIEYELKGCAKKKCVPDKKGRKRICNLATGRCILDNEKNRSKFSHGIEMDGQYIVGPKAAIDALKRALKSATSPERKAPAKRKQPKKKVPAKKTQKKTAKKGCITNKECPPDKYCFAGTARCRAKKKGFEKGMDKLILDDGREIWGSLDVLRSLRGELGGGKIVGVDKGKGEMNAQPKKPRKKKAQPKKPRKKRGDSKGKGEMDAQPKKRGRGRPKKVVEIEEEVPEFVEVDDFEVDSPREMPKSSKDIDKLKEEIVRDFEECMANIKRK